MPASEPAWKRRRATSPVRPQPNYYTPNPANVRNVNNVSNETPARNPRSGSGFETSKKLFENVGGSSWRDNDIARQQEEAKKKDMDVLLNRFKQVSKAEREQERERSRSRSPIKERSSPSPSSRSTRSPLRSTSPPKATKATSQYPGVSSVKKIKVSPTREGGLYPNLSDIHHSSESSDERPETAMSEESVAPSEAPSLGMAIKRAASANKLKRSPPKQMVAIAESSDDEAMDASDEDIENLLDEALDDSQAMTEDTSGPTPPKNRRHHSPSGASATSWEFATPSNPGRHHDFRTPRVDQITDSPQGELPLVDTEEGPAPATDLIRTVSHYRKQKPNVQVLPKVVRSVNVIEEANEDEEESEHDPRLGFDSVYSDFVFLVFLSLGMRLLCASTSCKRKPVNRCRGGCRPARPSAFALRKTNSKAPTKGSSLRDCSWRPITNTRPRTTKSSISRTWVPAVLSTRRRDPRERSALAASACR